MKETEIMILLREAQNELLDALSFMELFEESCSDERHLRKYDIVRDIEDYFKKIEGEKK